MADKISVLLVDDHSLVRRGFRRILEDEPDITVAGEASDGAEAVRLARELQPQVVVMDCAMPKMNGLEATRQILQKQPQTLVLMDDTPWRRNGGQTEARDQHRGGKEVVGVPAPSGRHPAGGPPAHRRLRPPAPAGEGDQAQPDRQPGEADPSGLL